MRSSAQFIKQTKSKQQGPLRAAPVIQSRVRSTGQPAITNSSPAGNVHVKHREFVADVLGSVAFSAVRFAVNPGRSDLFPWLSTIARRFESYRFKKLHFCFESLSSATTAGTVILSVDYDAADAAPTDKTSAMAYRGATRCGAWTECQHVSQTGDLLKLPSRYVRGDNLLAANLDVKTYDVGNLFVCAQNMASAAAVGELYVEYEVELLTPQLASSDLAGLRFTSAGAASGAIFGSAPVAVTGSNIDVTLTATTLTFNQQFDGLVILSHILASGASASTYGIGAGTSTESLLASSSDAGPATAIAVYSVRASPGQTFAPTGTVTGTVTADVRLCEYPVNLA